MWLQLASRNFVRRSIAPASALALMCAAPAWYAQAFTQFAAPRHMTNDTVRIQAGDAKLSGTWVSQTGEQFQITQGGEAVDMTYTGSTSAAPKGKISGNFDGAIFAGAYETTDGGTTDRGVVRFLRSPSGKLEGSWRSLVNGRQGTWSLTKK